MIVTRKSFPATHYATVAITDSVPDGATKIGFIVVAVRGYSQKSMNKAIFRLKDKASDNGGNVIHIENANSMFIGGSGGIHIYATVYHLSKE